MSVEGLTGLALPLRKDKEREGVSRQPVRGRLSSWDLWKPSPWKSSRVGRSGLSVLSKLFSPVREYIVFPNKHSFIKNLLEIKLLNIGTLEVSWSEVKGENNAYEVLSLPSSFILN